MTKGVVKPSKPHRHERHTGALFGCVDRRAGRHDMFNAEGWPEGLAEARYDFLGAYRHQTAANKINPSDPIAAQVISLGLGHGGKHAFVLGHSGVCGGMNAQHELHQLEHKLRMARRAGKSSEAHELAQEIDRLRQNEIYRQVGSDLRAFSVFESELRKIFKSDNEYGRFITTAKFRELAEEFNVMLQLSKLKDRPDFKEINSGRGKNDKMVLVGGMYEPKEELSPYGKLVPASGRVYFDFPKLYGTIGKKGVNGLLRALGLSYELGSGIFHYK